MKRIFIVAAFAAIFTSCLAPKSTSESVVVAPAAATIAYVDVDMVLATSEIFEKEGLPLQQRSDAARRDWAQQEQKLQTDAAQLQQKYQNGLITTANAQREEQKIADRVKAYQTSAQKQAAELDEENNVFANRTQQLLRTAISNINADKRYSMIVNAASLIDADSTLNISDSVLKEFNKLYNEESK